MSPADSTIVPESAEGLANVLYDFAIVGGGAAGLSAGITLARGMRKVVVLDAGNPRNRASPAAHGLLGHDGTSPVDLLARGRRDYETYGGEFRETTVHSAERSDDGNFQLEVVPSRSAVPEVVRSRAVIVATGLRDELPDIPGLQENWGTRVHHCPYCHGYESRGLDCVVIGGENHFFAVHQSALLKNWCPQVTLIQHGSPLSDEDSAMLRRADVDVVQQRVARVDIAKSDPDGGPNQRVAVHLIDGTRKLFGTLFTPPVFVPNDALLRQLGCEVEDGWVRVDQMCATSVPGVWAAGNCSSMGDQIAHAMARGTTAAMQANFWLLQQDLAAHEER
ncbi:NAD(P)/FAD-dependent oxidoreductase [Corynebacterium heidelbergense]|uniref:FAD/NAD(P)-binding domain-containing protein n=1 Tax=Corynebacterium heidelbergense TaxID=2055947 RepID=A0A364V4B1_9CORY|nr:NAD(P)/FAD-dependent oxidoreductase [Corynebacterium heidelbergense]RAV31461.1 hypothetical protein DLJ54_08210 [Corynebacterium heidelbergense]